MSPERSVQDETVSVDRDALDRYSGSDKFREALNLIAFRIMGVKLPELEHVHLMVREGLKDYWGSDTPWHPQVSPTCASQILPRFLFGEKDLIRVP